MNPEREHRSSAMGMTKLSWKFLKSTLHLTLMKKEVSESGPEEDEVNEERRSKRDRVGIWMKTFIVTMGLLSMVDGLEVNATKLKRVSLPLGKKGFLRPNLKSETE